MSPLRRLADFEGRWALSRVILPQAGAEGRFLGEAQWRDDGAGGLAYEERGQLTLKGQAPMEAERRYRWDAELNVYFDDGRFFHCVPRGGGDAAHWCAPDQYDVRYDFAAWPRFQVRWRVVGPRKNYEMISDYEPL